jgi:YfiH family protein
MKQYNTIDKITAFSTERGCYNPSLPYDGFNITYYTDDDPKHIATCRKMLSMVLNISDDHLILPRQVHGTEIAEVTEQNLGSRFDGVDALMTSMPHTCIGVSTADCVPILIYDTQARAIAAAHAGWRGTAARIGSKTVAAMLQRYSMSAADLKVVIGPSIGPDAFEVGDEVYEAFSQAGFEMNEIAFKRNGKWHIDLWQANALDLQQTGIARENIEIAGICTYQQHEDFFSARRLGIKSGRIYTGIVIRS